MADEVTKPATAATVKTEWFYKVSPAHEWRDSLITVSKNGERINLAGKEVKLKRDASESDPRTEITVRAATQEEMKDHFDKGFQDVIIKVKA